MDRLIHIALNAMRSAQTRQTVTANNLANAATTGFRAEIASASSLWAKGPSLPDRAFATAEVRAADMRAGAITSTGRPLDVALGGDALLAVQADDGDEGYTRRGDLTLDPSGILTTGDGHPVLGENGPVSLPPVDDVRIDASGELWIVPAGGDPAQPQLIDRLKLASPQGSAIVKHVDGLFRVRGGGVLPGDPDARVTAASLEGSNVNATTALVDMIEASRSWDTQVKLLTTARELDGATTNLMRLPS